MSAPQFPTVTPAMLAASVNHARTGGMPNRVRAQIRAKVKSQLTKEIFPWMSRPSAKP